MGKRINSRKDGAYNDCGIGTCNQRCVSCFLNFFGLKNNKRSDTKDIEERVKENTRINMKLDNISSSTQEIKEQISSLVRDVQKHGDRLVKVEEGVKRHDEALKRLHDRVDNVEDRLNKEDK